MPKKDAEKPKYPHFAQYVQKNNIVTFTYTSSLYNNSVFGLCTAISEFLPWKVPFLRPGNIIPHKSPPSFRIAAKFTTTIMFLQELNGINTRNNLRTTSIHFGVETFYSFHRHNILIIPLASIFQSKTLSGKVARKAEEFKAN